MSFDDKNQYMLRDNKTHVVNNRVFVGPEMLTLDLDDAYAIVHKLENSGEIRAAWKERNHEKLRKEQIAKRIAAFIRAGATPEEAKKKAEAVLLRQEEREAKAKADAARATDELAGDELAPTTEAAN